jgi:hypothetical protein
MKPFIAVQSARRKLDAGSHSDAVAKAHSGMLRVFECKKAARALLRAARCATVGFPVPPLVGSQPVSGAKVPGLAKIKNPPADRRA